MTSRWLPFLFAFALFASTGCKAKIGDSCSLSTDCSQQGDRLCDTTMPGGYCTIFNCEPGRCPSEAVCVIFHSQADPAKECSDPHRWARFERTFCMVNCDDDGDCRSGYRCAGAGDLSTDYGAKIASGDQAQKVCVPNASLPTDDGGNSTAVCTSYIDGGTYDVPYYDAGLPMSVDASTDAPTDAPTDGDASTDAAP